MDVIHECFTVLVGFVYTVVVVDVTTEDAVRMA